MSYYSLSSLAQTPFSNVPLHVRGVGGERSQLAELLQLMGSAEDPGWASDMSVLMRRLRSGETLFHQGARAEAVYFVRAGTFKTFRIAEDGYEQVLGFSGRAEVLGFDAICMGQHPTASIALEDSSVYAVSMRDILRPSQRIPALDQVVTLAVSRALTQQGELADVMAAVAAEVRLARFMLQLSSRMEACGQSPRRFRLRMGRRDIASHLGVAHETVSRSFQALARWSLLSVSNREVEILDMSGLKTLAHCTRRHLDDIDPLRSPGQAAGTAQAGRPVPDRAIA